MMLATLNDAPNHSADASRLEALGTSGDIDSGGSSGGLFLPLRIPDLNDPIIRRLPIFALALTLALLEASAQRAPDASAAGQ